MLTCTKSLLDLRPTKAATNPFAPTETEAAMISGVETVS